VNVAITSVYEGQQAHEKRTKASRKAKIGRGIRSNVETHQLRFCSQTGMLQLPLTTKATQLPPDAPKVDALFPIPKAMAAIEYPTHAGATRMDYPKCSIVLPSSYLQIIVSKSGMSDNAPVFSSGAGEGGDIG